MATNSVLPTLDPSYFPEYEYLESLDVFMCPVCACYHKNPLKLAEHVCNLNAALNSIRCRKCGKEASAHMKTIDPRSGLEVSLYFCKECYIAVFFGMTMPAPHQRCKSCSHYSKRYGFNSAVMGPCYGCDFGPDGSETIERDAIMQEHDFQPKVKQGRYPRLESYLRK